MRLLLLAALAAFFVSPAQATPCASADRIIDELKLDHGQKLTGAGIVDFLDIAAELWVAPDGRWTLIARAASGTTCIQSRGHDWTADPKELPQPEEDK